MSEPTDTPPAQPAGITFLNGTRLVPGHAYQPGLRGECAYCGCDSRHEIHDGYDAVPPGFSPPAPVEVVRVLRVVEYEGPREWVERTVANSIHGERRIPLGSAGSKGLAVIRAVTVNNFPVVVPPKPGEGGAA
jgi:hypothetical protein